MFAANERDPANSSTLLLGNGEQEQPRSLLGQLVDWDFNDGLDGPSIRCLGQSIADAEIELERLHVDVDDAVDAIVLLVPGLYMADLPQIGVVFHPRG